MRWDFFLFIWGNLDSLSDSGLISFDKEMVHIKDYLYLEKMRFAERLNIRQEIIYEDFMLPSLSVQPIIENAVQWVSGDKERTGTWYRSEDHYTASKVIFAVY